MRPLSGHRALRGEGHQENAPRAKTKQGGTATEVTGESPQCPGQICSTAVCRHLPSRDAGPHPVFAVTVVFSVLQAALGHVTGISFSILSRIHGGILLFVL